MSCTPKEKFERSCRLCAEEQEVTIMIFSREAEALLLQKKLNQYLLIEVDENDTLPKNICIRCCSKLHSVCEFIDTARKAQEMLLSRSILLQQASHVVPTEVKCHASEATRQNFFDSESSVTPMEISVDPMVVLQNCESSDVTGYDEGIEQPTFLHGLESENVTIKLIRRSTAVETYREVPVEQHPFDSFKPFPCVVCKRSFLTELALKNHAWTHNNEDRGENPFACSLCNNSFEYKSDLLAHLKDHKSNVTCKVCARVFRSEENLRLHMESHKSPWRSYTCKVCSRSYNTSSNLKTHSITHSNERPYQCHLCKKSFKRNQDLKFHINQHTGARPYKCPYCEKCFASSGNCYSHRNRMHPGCKDALTVKSKPAIIKRRRKGARTEAEAVPTLHNGQNTSSFRQNKSTFTYKCDICGHGFMKKDNFTYHMYQHTGDKPFQCSYCTEKFVTRRGLTIHHDRAHPQLERPLSLLTRNVLLK